MFYEVDHGDLSWFTSNGMLHKLHPSRVGLGYLAVLGVA